MINIKMIIIFIDFIHLIQNHSFLLKRKCESCESIFHFFLLPPILDHVIFNFGDWQQNLMRAGLRNYKLTLHGLIQSKKVMTYLWVLLHLSRDCVIQKTSL